MLATRRLPGIAVEATPPTPTETLPRMDVAVFVGFASTGPLHLPVVVESVSQFAAVFGPDAPLAWDGARGERIYAYLGPAVRAFFSNGGRRCWVVRVARTSELESLRGGAGTAEPPTVAVANTFAVPGVLEVGADGALSPALAQARCEGSWSDGLRVATALSRQSFTIDAVESTSPPGALRFETRAGLRVGDLIELDEPADTVTYATIDVVEASSEPGGPYGVEAMICGAFERITADASPATPAAASTGDARIEGVVEAAATFWPPDDSAADGDARLRFDAPVPASLECGHWARWSDGVSEVWLRIDEIERTPVFDASPATPVALVEATVMGPAWRRLDTALASLEASRRAHLLTIDLRAEDEATSGRLTELGLTPAHRASWWLQQPDEEFYRIAEDAAAANPTAGNADRLTRSDAVRFALARIAGSAPVAWLPLGVTPVFEAAVAPLPQAATALERDGLATFDASLFLDPELADIRTSGLIEMADAIRFIRDVPRSLYGLHAAMSVGRGGLFNEASLLAIPDAVHAGWDRRADAVIAEATPAAGPRPPEWTTHRGPCAAASAEAQDGPDFGNFLDCETRVIEAPELFGPEAPVSPGAFRLTWTSSETDAEYVLVEATQSDLSDAREVARGAETEYVALAQREGIYYFRVEAHVDGERSDGSNVVGVLVRRDEWELRDTAAYGTTVEGECLAVHRAALRAAAATGDLFVALAMPRHFRTQDALRYAQRLRAVNEPFGAREPGAFDFTESRALSYGALYFPWLQSEVRAPSITATGAATTRIVSFGSAQPTVVPPDGAAAGVLSARASTRGAWIAAANQPFRDVVALAPGIPASDWQRLQDAQINLVRAEPRGFLTLAADTLALEPELRLINVRRLLSLLRRVALRRGHSYVFEPHGPTLRRAVQRGFEQLLTEMFRRGAFAGATAAQSFRVVADDTVNTARDMDAGRFTVELRVAPSVPLAFMTVRLAQSGARLTVSEEL